MSNSRIPLKNIIEAALLVQGKPMTIKQLQAIFESDDEKPSSNDISDALTELAEDLSERAIELIEVASGFRIQVRQGLQQWMTCLFQEKSPRYSRALLETLALVAYRQPITRSEVEQVRGVSVSTHIIKTLLEREWVRIVAHKEVPGRPAMYGTTKQFLDYFNIKSIADLPTLGEIKNLDEIGERMQLSAAQADLLSQTPESDENPEEQQVENGEVEETEPSEQQDQEADLDDSSSPQDNAEMILEPEQVEAIEINAEGLLREDEGDMNFESPIKTDSIH